MSLCVLWGSDAEREERGVRKVPGWSLSPPADLGGNPPRPREAHGLTCSPRRLDCAGLASQRPLWVVLPESLLRARQGLKRQGGRGQAAPLSPKDTGTRTGAAGAPMALNLVWEGLQVRGRPEGGAEGVEGSAVQRGEGWGAVAGPVWGWGLGPVCQRRTHFIAQFDT